eukprot:325157-Chlamydomonas_euryale.AAC.1
MDACMDGWMHAWRDRGMEGWMHACLHARTCTHAIAELEPWSVRGAHTTYDSDMKLLRQASKRAARAKSTDTIPWMWQQMEEPASDNEAEEGE